MKPVIVPTAFLLVFGASQAMAQVCPTSIGSALSGSTLTTLLSGKYACVGTYPNAQWNELHSGSSVIDFKKGPSDPVDPSTTVGSYSISGGTKSGVVTYNYGAGGTYSYRVFANLGATPPAAGHYSFCTTGGGVNLDVTVGMTTGHGGCP